jgi:hypothetical protein
MKNQISENSENRKNDKPNTEGDKPSISNFNLVNNQAAKAPKLFKHVLWPMVFVASVQALAESDRIMGGIDRGNKWLFRASIGVSTVGIIFAGLLTVYNKERGFDKISGAIIGCIVIAGASALVALIQTFFGM